MTAKKKTASEKEETSFEASLQRLETIVEEMEDGELSLDDMIRRFEEGQSLVKFCTRKLDDVDRKVEKLVQQDDGELTTEPLDPEDEAADTSTDEDHGELF